MQNEEHLEARRRVVVVVDDDHAVRDSMTFSLQIEGFDVRAYASPNDLLTGGDLTDAACLITNYNMPTMNGLEMMATLRERGVTTPGLLITGHCTESMRRRALAVGLTVVEKPFLGKPLFEQIRQALNSGAWRP